MSDSCQNACFLHCCSFYNIHVGAFCPETSWRLSVFSTHLSRVWWFRFDVHGVHTRPILWSLVRPPSGRQLVNRLEWRHVTQVLLAAMQATTLDIVLLLVRLLLLLPVGLLQGVGQHVPVSAGAEHSLGGLGAHVCRNLCQSQRPVVRAVRVHVRRRPRRRIRHVTLFCGPRWRGGRRKRNRGVVVLGGGRPLQLLFVLVRSRRLLSFVLGAVHLPVVLFAETVRVQFLVSAGKVLVHGLLHHLPEFLHRVGGDGGGGGGRRHGHDGPGLQAHRHVHDGGLRFVGHGQTRTLSRPNGRRRRLDNGHRGHVRAVLHVRCGRFVVEFPFAVIERYRRFKTVVVVQWRRVNVVGVLRSQRRSPIPAHEHRGRRWRRACGPASRPGPSAGFISRRSLLRVRALVRPALRELRERLVRKPGRRRLVVLSSGPTDRIRCRVGLVTFEVVLGAHNDLLPTRLNFVLMVTARCQPQVPVP